MHAVFVDSNILIYSQDATDSHKQARAQDWLEHLWQNRSGRISYQVLREVYLNLTRKVPNPLPAPRVRVLVRLFFPWKPRPENTEFFEVAWDVESRFQLSCLPKQLWIAFSSSSTERNQIDYSLQ